MCNRLAIKTVIVYFAFFCVVHAYPVETTLIVKNIRKCFDLPHPTLCLKEEALGALNRTIFNENPIRMFDGIIMARNPNYTPNVTSPEFPSDYTSRNLQLNQALYSGVEELLKSRVLKFHIDDLVEGRAKSRRKRRGSKRRPTGQGGKTKIAVLKHQNQNQMDTMPMMMSLGGMVMMGGMTMVGMMAQMIIGKIAFVAGTAILVAKMALMISLVTALKKIASSGGGHGHGHHGSWDRNFMGPGGHHPYGEYNSDLPIYKS